MNQLHLKRIDGPVESTQGQALSLWVVLGHRHFFGVNTIFTDEACLVGIIQVLGIKDSNGGNTLLTSKRVISVDGQLLDGLVDKLELVVFVGA